VWSSPTAPRFDGLAAAWTLQLPPRQRRDERTDVVGGRQRRWADANDVRELRPHVREFLPFSPVSRIQRRV
jgi:hypothetical protein